MSDLQNQNESQKQEAPVNELKAPKEVKLANINKINLSNFFENAIFTKAITNDELNYLSDNSVSQNRRILNIVDLVVDYNPTVEKDILKLVFEGVYWYKTQTTNDVIIPIVLKELFSNSDVIDIPWFKKEHRAALLNSTFIPFDINKDTLLVLTRTPELPSWFKDKIEPLLKAKRLKNVEVRITTRELYEYYKQMLTYNQISDEV